MRAWLRHLGRGMAGLMVLAMCSLAPGQQTEVTVRLPLDGYYRPGRYMPVHVTIARSSHPLAEAMVLRADGSVATSVGSLSSRQIVIAPLLPLQFPLRDLRWSEAGGAEHPLKVEFRALGEHERLVAFAGINTAPPLFPGNSLIIIRLDSTNPLPGAPACWECLDALILDPASAQRITEAQSTTLLAGGTTLAIRSPTRPASKWPWKQMGEFWVLRPPTLPHVDSFNDTAYKPTGAWSPSLPWSLRSAVVLAAIAFSILVLAAALLRPRLAVIITMAVVLVGVSAIDFWSDKQSPLTQINGAIMVVHPQATCVDEWSYQTTRRTTKAMMTWTEAAHPVFANAEQARNTRMMLMCDSNGRPLGFSYALPANARQAFVRRTLAPTPPDLTKLTATTSPMRELAKSLYLQADQRVAGQLPVTRGVGWPTVVVK